MYKIVLQNLMALPRIPARLFNRYVWLFLLFVGLVSQVSTFDTKFVFTSSKYILRYLNLSPMPVFGPELVTIRSGEERQSYRFSKNQKSFNGNFSLKTLNTIEPAVLKKLLLSGVPADVKSRMAKYLDTILIYSEKHKLDPLWVLSITWVESHFKSSAVSSVGAAGLMQIMPRTSVYLNKLQNIDLPLSVSYKTSYDPTQNIALGSFYLKKLLKRFSGNYIHATVAYNMGPTYTRRRLRQRGAVGKRNKYLTKVRRAYSVLFNPVKSYLSSQNKSSDHIVATRQ
jgi:soluble lytic murein transglycosylase-like protein